MTPETDKSQIGLTKENKEVMQRIEGLGYFPNQMEAAKFALSLAIKSGLRPGKVAQAETTWHTGSLDPLNELSSMIKTLFPETTTPYRIAEFYINEGLVMISNKMSPNGHLDLADLIV